jgi:hypothetical protein
VRAKNSGAKNSKKRRVGGGLGGKQSQALLVCGLAKKLNKSG